MFEFEVHYDPKSASAAERAFLIRSWRQLRRLNLMAIPALLVLALVAARLAPDSWASRFFWAMFALAIAHPLVMLVLRPWAAGRYAVKVPVRRVSLSPDGLTIQTGEHPSTIGWQRIKYVWHEAGSLIFVLGAFGSVAIPSASLPSGAREYIERFVQAGA
jgi:hypothetical protein